VTTETQINEARQYLEMIESLRQKHVAGEFLSPYAYILKNGREWGPRIFPAGVKKMKDKACFQNAYNLSQKKGYRYVEGMATSIIPCDHAWCVNDQGEVIDPTWGKTFLSGKERGPADYFGVEIPVEKLHKIMLLTRVYGVFGNWQQWDEVLKILNEETKTRTA
jgi:hypothetical protein